MVITSQLQLEPRSTEPLKPNPGVSNGRELARGAPKCRGCGPEKSSSSARSTGRARSTLTSCPSTGIRAYTCSGGMGLSALAARQHGAAMSAGTARCAREEALEHRRELLLDVGQRKELLVQQLAAALAVPLKTVQLTRTARPFDDQAHGVGGALRGVWQVGRDEQYLAGTNRHIHRPSVLHGPEHHVALELIEEFLPGVDVIVLARVRATDHHDDEIAVAEHALVAHRRLELRAVLVDPLPEIESVQGLHVASVAMAYV